MKKKKKNAAKLQGRKKNVRLSSTRGEKKKNLLKRKKANSDDMARLEPPTGEYKQ